jgi:hypothetical protein
MVIFSLSGAQKHLVLSGAHEKLPTHIIYRE